MHRDGAPATDGPSPETTTTIVMLHAFGASAASFEPVRRALPPGLRLVAIDLPGYGEAREAEGVAVADTVRHVAGRIRDAHDGGRFLLGGHSMGGKIAQLVAARILAGDVPVFGLAGLVLLSPSPARPEPMDDDRRARMLSWAADGPLSREDAEFFVGENVARPLPDPVHERAVADLQAASPVAWRSWLEDGSRLDARGEIGTLDLPALVLAGTDDADLGAAAQPALVADTLPRARVRALPETGHLLPGERPREVADAIAAFVRDEIAPSPAVPVEWSALIGGARVDAATRGILARRAVPDDPAYAPRVLTDAQLALLRELADHLVPQEGPSIDAAARVDAQLAAGGGDGWRASILPPDAEAYRRGLDVMADASGGSLVRNVVERALAGEIAGDGFDAEQVVAWLEDARVDLVRHVLTHPATLARIGYDGFATAAPEPGVGFAALALGRREGWEPADVGGAVHDEETKGVEA